MISFPSGHIHFEGWDEPFLAQLGAFLCDPHAKVHALPVRNHHSLTSKDFHSYQVEVHHCAVQNIYVQMSLRDKPSKNIITGQDRFTRISKRFWKKNCSTYHIQNVNNERNMGYQKFSIWLWKEAHHCKPAISLSSIVIKNSTHQNITLPPLQAFPRWTLLWQPTLLQLLQNMSTYMITLSKNIAKSLHLKSNQI